MADLNDSLNRIDLSMLLKFWDNFVTTPSVKAFHHLHDEHIQNYEDHLFKELHNHRDVFTRNEVTKMLKLISVPMILPYIITVFVVLSIIAIPCFCFKQFCKRTHVTQVEHPCCFCLQIIIMMMFIMLLAISTAGSLEICLKLDSSIRDNVLVARSLVKDLQNENKKFDTQLNEVNSTIMNMLLSSQQLIANLPENISEELLGNNKKHMNDIIKRFQEKISKIDVSKEVQGINNTDMITIQRLAEKFNSTEKIMVRILKDIKTLESYVKQDVNFKEHQQNFLDNIKQIKNYTANIKGNYRFPDWQMVNTRLNYTLNVLEPEIKNSLHFMNLYPEVIMNNIKYERETIGNSTDKLKDQSNMILKKLKNILRNIYPEIIKNHTRNVISAAENTLYDINGNTTLCGKLYGSGLIIIMPSLHTLLYVALMMFACVYTIYTMQNIHIYTWYGSSENSCVIILLKLINLFGVSLLWATLLLSTLCYMGALSLSIVCRPITTDHIYTKYIDNQQVWSNNTWMDTVVQPWGHGYKVKDILDKCSKGVTVYEAFDVKKYWNVSELFENNKISVNNTRLTGLIENAILSVQLPDKNKMLRARDNFSNVEMEITTKISPHIMYDVDVLQNKELNKPFENMMEVIPADSLLFEKLKEMLEKLKFIQNQNVFSNLMEFKYILILVQEELTNIINLNREIFETINSNKHIVTTTHVTNMAHSIEDMQHDTCRKLSHRIISDIGKCHRIPAIFNTAKQRACIQMPQVLNNAWTLLLLNGVLLVLCLILSCLICRCIIRIHVISKNNAVRIQDQHLNQQQQRV